MQGFAADLRIGEEAFGGMRFIGAEETDEERLVAYVDRGPEALKFFEDLGVRFRISRGLTDHYFGVAPGSVAEGRCLNTEFIAATDLGEWQDAILSPRDTPIEVNSTELFEWGGIANIDNWPKEIMIGLIAFCALVFVKGLGVPMPLLGSWLGG